MKNKDIISVNNLSFKIGKSTILSNISLTISEGDFISVIGPNGAGKTTLIKAIINLINPSSGNIYVNGSDIKSYKRKDLAKIISYIPQTVNLDYGFTVEEIVLMGRIPYISFFGDYSIVDYKQSELAMKTLDILHLRYRMLSSLSGGEIQRVFLARALAQNSKILILDEAMSELDIGHQISMIKILNELHDSKKLTIISVMHDINIAYNFFNKCIILNKGILQADGNTKEIITPELLKSVFNINSHIENNFLNYII